MKFIFDFDDTLFDTKNFKEHIFLCLDKVGVSYDTAKAYYQKVRGGEFSLKNFISELLTQEKMKVVKTGQVYEQIMSKCPDFINRKLIDIVQKMGKENCYLVTYGEKDFNRAKVEQSGIAPLFSEIHIVSGSKKIIIEDICERNKNDKVVFIDNKAEFFQDLDMVKYPNLETLLYDEKGLEKITSILS